MKLSVKIAASALILSSFGTSEISADEKCFDLDLKELRQLCRWSGLSKIPLLGIRAGFVEKNGITLRNKLKTCGEGDSLKQFLSQDSDKVYEGKFSKHPSDPSPLKGLCTYSIDGQYIGFEVDLPPKMEQAMEQAKERKNPKLIRGAVDPTFSPKPVDVVIRGTGEGSVAESQEQARIHREAKLREEAEKKTHAMPTPTPQTGSRQATLEELKKNPPSEPPPRPVRRELPTPPKATPAPETQDKSAEMSQDFRSELAKRLEQQRARAQAQ